MTPLPLLATGDVYLYAHANGAISLRYGDGRSMLVPLAEAIAVAKGCTAAGCRVVAGRDEGPMAVGVIEQLRSSEVPVERFAASEAPHSWSEGTDALIEAASAGADRILDDLLERGADLHHRDVSGSTALHHAAATGNVHAIDRLVAAGADIDLVNDQGFTPLHLARACREPDAIARLVELGASVAGAAGTGEAVRFSRAHAGVAYVWLVPLAFVVVAAIAFRPLSPVGAVGLLAFAAAVVFVAPPWAFWLGGAPVSLDGTVLEVRAPFRRARTVDLVDTTVAAMGGSTHRGARLGARWILLGHPSGAPVNRRTLRRLQVAPADLDAVAERMDRVVVIPISGGRTAEVILPIGNALSSLGVDLASGLRAQLAQTRGAST